MIRVVADENKPVAAQRHVEWIGIFQPQVQDQYAARLGLAHNRFGQLDDIVCATIRLHLVRPAKLLRLLDPQHRHQPEARPDRRDHDQHHPALDAFAHSPRAVKFKIPIAAMPVTERANTTRRKIATVSCTNLLAMLAPNVFWAGGKC